MKLTLVNLLSTIALIMAFIESVVGDGRGMGDDWTLDGC